MTTVLKYPGSKWRIARKIIELMPEHHTYIEPYLGSGAVLLNKEPSPIETVNDLDHEVVNLFSCIREDPERLGWLVEATPYARREYELTYEEQGTSDRYEQARRFLVKLCQGYGYRTNGEKVGWKNDVQGREKAYAALYWERMPEWIAEAAQRIKTVQIDSRPALDFIARHRHHGVLIYADPPYLPETRQKKKIYRHEMTEEDHEELLEILKAHPGPVILSGYENGMYNTILQDWEKVKLKTQAQNGSARIEVLWMNFHKNKAMEGGDQQTTFLTQKKKSTSERGRD